MRDLPTHRNGTRTGTGMGNGGRIIIVIPQEIKVKARG
jgi:hypothetical protein